MVYKLYLKDEYGKKTLLAKSENKDLIEKAKYEYDNKGTLPIEYSLLILLILICLSALVGYSSQRYLGLRFDYSIMLSFGTFLISTSLISALYNNENRIDGRIYIIWEDPK